MADQRVEGGSALGGKDTGDGRSIAGIPTQPIDGFRGECDKPPTTQQISRAGDVFI